MMNDDELMHELELEVGKRTAELLVAHCERMDVANVTIPAEGKDCSVWRVTATLVAKG